MRSVSVYFLAFAGTHCAYPWRDGQAELSWVAGYIPRWFTRLQTVTHTTTNRARRRVTSLITTKTLTTKPNHHLMVLVVVSVTQNYVPYLSARLTCIWLLWFYKTLSLSNLSVLCVHSFDFRTSCWTKSSFIVRDR